MDKTSIPASELEQAADKAYQEVQRLEAWRPWDTVARSRAVDKYAAAAEALRAAKS